MKKQIIHVTVASSILFSVSVPFTTHIKAAEVSNQQENVHLTNTETQNLLKLQNELQAHGIAETDIVNGIQSSLSGEDTENHVVTTFGVKSKTAKVAAKSMIKKLKKIGRISWDRTVRNYVNKLPISKGSKSTLKKYLSYEFVMKTLNIVVDFEGTITNALTTQLKNMGVPSWLAGTAARALVTLLL